MYTVTHISSVDCYKRPDTSSEVIYTGSNYKDALLVAVGKWLTLFGWVYEDQEDWQSELLEILPNGEPTEKELETIHHFFENNTNRFWPSEFIPNPYEEIQISKFKEESTISSDKVMNWIRDFRQEAMEDFDSEEEECIL